MEHANVYWNQVYFSNRVASFLPSKFETISDWPAGHVVHLRPNPLALSIFFLSVENMAILF